MAVLLIVEDDTATNEAICEYMRSAGHITLSALDGEQGLPVSYTHLDVYKRQRYRHPHWHFPA